jgi:hypothetical protein
VAYLFSVGLILIHTYSQLCLLLALIGCSEAFLSCVKIARSAQVSASQKTILD